MNVWLRGAVSLFVMGIGLPAASTLLIESAFPPQSFMRLAGWLVMIPVTLLAAKGLYDWLADAALPVALPPGAGRHFAPEREERFHA